MTDLNPYAAPATAGKSTSPPGGPEPSGSDSWDQAWRAGKQLVLGKSTRLPHRCIRCNSSHRVVARRRKLSWYPMAPVVAVLLLTCLVFPFVFLLVLGQRHAVVVMGICDPCNRHQRKRSLQATLVVMGGIALMVASGIAPLFMPIPSTIRFGCMVLLLICGIAMIDAGIIFGFVHREIVSVAKIDRENIWLNWVSEQYMAQFPEWQGRI